MSSEAAVYFPDSLRNSTAKGSPASKSSLYGCKKNEASTIVATHIRTEGALDEDLLLQVTHGSREALSILFRRHGRTVFSVARRILRDDSEAEDLLQELFLFLFQKAGLFDAAKGSATSWIIQMTYHRAIDRRRYLNTRHHYTVEEFHEERQQASMGLASFGQVDDRCLLNEVRKELSNEQYKTLELHFFEGYTLHEIAQKTGQSFGNVRNHYYRGLKRLRSHIFPENARLK